MHPQIEFLLNHAATATPFASPQGRAFVTLPLGLFSRQVVPLHSPRFRDWLVAAFFNEHHEPPTPYALRQTIRTISALTKASSLSVHRRVASRGNPHRPDAILLDLRNPDGEFVEITPSGWQVTTDPTAAFLHSRGNAELPAPESRAPSPQPLAALQQLLNLSPEGFYRTLVWLLTALRPSGPHPILVLEGPPSSGKSTAARMLRSLIDPSAAPLLSLPYSEAELLAIAQHNWILAFDHVGAIRQQPSDTLCRLATGAAIRHRDKGDEREPVAEELRRPILITATADWNPDESLAARILTVNFTSPQTRRTESDLWQEFESLRPAILAALCDAVSTALRSPAPSPQSPVPSFADAARWSISAFPTREQQILVALNQTPTTPILDSISTLLQKTPQWTGTATDLLREISVISVINTTSHALSHHLRRHQNLLESNNIHVAFTRQRTGKRLMTLTLQSPRIQPPVPSPQPPAPGLLS